MEILSGGAASLYAAAHALSRAHPWRVGPTAPAAPTLPAPGHTISIARYRQGHYDLAFMGRLKADFLLLLAAAVWGVAFYFQKSAMEHIGPFLFIASRGLVAAICLTPLALLEARSVAVPWSGSFVKLAMAGGLIFLTAAAVQQIGIVDATVTNAGFLTGLYVIATPLIAWVLFGMRPAMHVWIAVALAFTGVWLLAGGTVGGFSTGDGLIAISASFWALHMVMTSRASVRYGRPVAYTAMLFAFVACSGAVLAITFETNTLDGLINALPAIAYVGVLSSALTFTLLAIALKNTPPSEASILMSTETLFAAAAGVLLANEWLAPIGWIGAGLMFSASILVQIGPFLERRRTKPF